jgi:murein DD-endopeptidase MepM/ murein hydrolase activator NlpD
MSSHREESLPLLNLVVQREYVPTRFPIVKKDLMAMKLKRLQKICSLCAIFFVLTSFPIGIVSTWQAMFQSTAAYAAGYQQQRSFIYPFMHRPYYGYHTIMQRSISFFDHDKPWYANDGKFVRFDGVVSHASVYDCFARVSCYDGHNGYDMDLSFEPVLSVAPGRVMRAGWYNPLNHSSSFGLWVVVNHGNGIVTSYGHLSSVLVAVGDRIGTQWQIGTSGTTGDSSGPHLHMSAFYLPDWQATDPFGWHGRYADPNIVPDRYLWVNAPATHIVVPYLGGPRIYPGAVFVDDSSRGWSTQGWWRRNASRTDNRGGLHWTNTTYGNPTAVASWRPTIPVSGYYEVGVYVDDTYATGGWVPYTVHSASPYNPAVPVAHTVRLDEAHIGIFNGPFGTVSTGTQWVSLGTYYFKRGRVGHVVMSNATGESDCQVAADGMEFVPVRG